MICHDFKLVSCTDLAFCISIAAVAGAWVLFISTDYVFDGTKPPYKTTDEPHPLNKYGLSKLEGENVTLINDGKSSKMLF